VSANLRIVPDISIFVRGDADGDVDVDISDPIWTLDHLFLGGQVPRCPDAADANDDGRIDLSDPIATLAWLFLGGHPLAAPYGSAGKDPTPDGLPGCIGGR